MRFTLMSVLTALAVGAGVAATAADDPKAKPRTADAALGGLFDGKGLDGWEGLTEYWTWKDGALIGSYTDSKLKENTFLCSKKKYKDFELKFKIRLKEGEGNSGVQIRSEVLDKGKFTVKGPQCDIGQEFWGSLYGENFGGMMKASDAALVKKILKPSDFNDYSIKCVGKHVTIKLNGETTVDQDFDKMPDDGILAWQLHSGFKFMEVTFKDIEFKDLNEKK
jgi:hypothetical protein